MPKPSFIFQVLSTPVFIQCPVKRTNLTVYEISLCLTYICLDVNIWQGCYFKMFASLIIMYHISKLIVRCKWLFTNKYSPKRAPRLGDDAGGGVLR